MADNSNKLNTQEYKGVSRYNDKGLGLPDFEPENTRTLSDAESARHQQELEEEMRREFAQKLNDLDNGKSVFKFSKGMQKAIRTVLLVVVGLLGLFVITEGVDFYQTLGYMNAPYNYIIGILALIFGLLLVFVIIRLIIVFFRLKRTNSVNLRALETLAERQRWQVLAEEHAKDAKERFVKYLKDYDLSGRRETLYVSLGFSQDDFFKLAHTKDRLIDIAEQASARAWLKDFKASFQDTLDTFALKRSRQYALRVGVGTAVSPIKFLDQMIVLYASVAMVKDMCVIYNLRPGFGQTMVILARSIVNTYLSGVITESAGDAADSVSEWLKEISGLLGSGLGRFVGTRASEGALNGFLLWRLGKRVVALLRLVK